MLDLSYPFILAVLVIFSAALDLSKLVLNHLALTLLCSHLILVDLNPLDSFSDHFSDEELAIAQFAYPASLLSAGYVSLAVGKTYVELTCLLVQALLAVVHAAKVAVVPHFLDVFGKLFSAGVAPFLHLMILVFVSNRKYLVLLIEFVHSITNHES